MRKSALVLLLLVTSEIGFSGGSVGGNPPLKQLDTLELMSLAVEKLPKAYASIDEFRRVSARLEVSNADTVPMSLAGETIQVRKLRDSIVDEKILKEILPGQE